MATLSSVLEAAASAATSEGTSGHAADVGGEDAEWGAQNENETFAAKHKVWVHSMPCCQCSHDE